MCSHNDTECKIEYVCMYVLPGLRVGSGGGGGVAVGNNKSYPGYNTLDIIKRTQNVPTLK